MLQCLTKISAVHIFIHVAITTLCLGFTQTGDVLEFISEPSIQMISRDRRGIFRCRASPLGAHTEWLQNGHPVQEDSLGMIRIYENKLVVKLKNVSHEAFPPKSPEHVNLQVAKGKHYLQCLARYKDQAIISQRSGVMLAEMSHFPSQPDVHISVIRGNTAAIICNPPESVPRAITEFTFNGHKIDIRNDKYIHLPSGNLHILDAQHSDAGIYQCFAHNPFLNERKSAKHKVHLKVVEGTHHKHVNLTLVPGPSPVSVAMGVNLTFECLADGFPIPTIRWHRKGAHPLPTRHHQLAGNLQLFTVGTSDEGIYVCKGQNELGKMSAEVELKVLEIPHILRSPEKHQSLEGDTVVFSCASEGKPLPDITWYHDGEKIRENFHFVRNDSSLWVRNIKKTHEGIYQCFASNDVGSVHASGLLTVFSDQPVSPNSTKLGNDYYGGPGFNEDEEDPEDVFQGIKRVKQKGVKMVPPSRPEVARLSEDSVMVRWTVPHNNGLPINFFKVQFQEFDRNRGGEWNTIDEDIPVHISSYAVLHLKPGGKYKFRIAAVYSNNDNRIGPKSAKFTLSRNPLLKRPQFAPVIVEAKAQSPSAITIKWKFADNRDTTIQGFFIYYRTTDSAGDYFKSTVIGANTQVHTISYLLPQTSYDIKMQCFNAAGPSDFSNIYTCKTESSSPLNADRNEDPEVKSPYPAMETDKTDNSNRYVTLSIVLGVLGLLVLVLVLWVLIKRCYQRHPYSQDNQGNVQNASAPPKHMVNGYSQNGFLDPSKINIQVNPLSDGEGNNKTIEGPYSLMEYQEEPFNNNEVILLGNLQRNSKNSTGI